jgi:hypothetical protein
MTATAPPVTATAGERSSTSRLADAVRNLATRASRPDAERVLRLAGPVLLPTGAIVILLGWYGAANTTRVFLQIPYLISGGLLGLGLMFAGGFLYFARWITDLLEESRRTATEAHEVAERTAVALERIERLLEERAVPTDPASGAAPAVASGSPTLVATERGSMLHRPDCRLVTGRPTRPATAGEGLRRCQICRPPVG